MRFIGLEEHFATPVSMAYMEKKMSFVPIKAFLPRLEIGNARLEEMDEAGIDMSVFSTPVTGIEELEPAEGIEVCKVVNDSLAEAMATHPDRFGGFAVLPLMDPEAAANELERTVTELGFKGTLINGHVRGRFLDDQAFDPVFGRAQALVVPIYLHPTLPPDGVFDTYYAGLPGLTSNMLQGAWGWYQETGMHALRMVLGGVFDRFPNLQVILGHMGEMIPYSLGRLDYLLTKFASHLDHNIEEYFCRNFYISTSASSASCASLPSLQCAISVMGVDRILFATDSPFFPPADVVDFIENAAIAQADKEKIAHGNAERLLGL